MINDRTVLAVVNRKGGTSKTQELPTDELHGGAPSDAAPFARRVDKINCKLSPTRKIYIGLLSISL